MIQKTLPFLILSIICCCIGLPSAPVCPSGMPFSTMQNPRRAFPQILFPHMSQGRAVHCLHPWSGFPQYQQLEVLGFPCFTSVFAAVTSAVGGFGASGTSLIVVLVSRRAALSMLQIAFINLLQGGRLTAAGVISKPVNPKCVSRMSFDCLHSPGRASSTMQYGRIECPLLTLGSRKISF